MRLTKNFIKLSAGTIVILALLVAVSPLASAFSSFGDGSSDLPFRVGSCAQLQEMNNNLTASYVLIRDIDCTGFDFTPIGTNDVFSGTLNGRGYSINNLSIVQNNDDMGLFSTLGGTVTNLVLTSPTIHGTGYIGALAGDTSLSTISDVRVVNPDISTLGSIAGGLVGDLGGATVRRTSVVGGSITGGGNVGGLIGRDNNGSSIYDSYTNSTVTGTLFVGGLIGQFKPGALLVANAYAAGPVNGSSTDMGGLIGFMNASSGAVVSNSFSVASLAGSTGSTGKGGLIGYQQGGTVTNSFFDQGRGGVSGLTCISTGSTGCTVVDSDSSDLGDFTGNSTVAPLDGWDFTDTWQAVDGDFPTLFALGNFVGGAVPNSGDANGDGQPDNFQTNVISVSNPDNIWSTIEVSGDSGCSIDYPEWANPEATDTGFTRKLSTMTAFSLYCNTAGQTVPVTIIYDKQYDTTGWTLRYYNSGDQSYSTVSDAVFGSRTVGGVVKTTVTYNVTDGGSLDSDGLANGVIVDPVAPAVKLVVPSTSAITGVGVPNTGLGRQSGDSVGGDIALTSFTLSFVGVGLYIRKRLRDA